MSRPGLQPDDLRDPPDSDADFGGHKTDPKGKGRAEPSRDLDELLRQERPVIAALCDALRARKIQLDSHMDDVDLDRNGVVEVIVNMFESWNKS